MVEGNTRYSGCTCDIGRCYFLLSASEIAYSYLCKQGW